MPEKDDLPSRVFYFTRADLPSAAGVYTVVKEEKIPGVCTNLVSRLVSIEGATVCRREEFGGMRQVG